MSLYLMNERVRTYYNTSWRYSIAYPLAVWFFPRQNRSFFEKRKQIAADEHKGTIHDFYIKYWILQGKLVAMISIVGLIMRFVRDLPFLYTFSLTCLPIGHHGSISLNLTTKVNAYQPFSSLQWMLLSLISGASTVFTVFCSQSSKN